MDHEHRRRDVLDEQVRAVGRDHRRRDLPPPVVVRVGRRTEVLERPQAGVGDDALEAVGVCRHPVRHVAAERAAHRPSARSVDVGPLLGGVGDRHQIGVWRRTPRSPAAGDERPSVSGRQRRIGQQHRVAGGSHQPWVPPPRPPVPGVQRAAVDPQQQGRRRRLARAFGQHEPPSHRRSIAGGRRHLGQRTWQGRRGSRAAQHCRLLVCARRRDAHRAGAASIAVRIAYTQRPSGSTQTPE